MSGGRVCGLVEVRVWGECGFVVVDVVDVVVVM